MTSPSISRKHLRQPLVQLRLLVRDDSDHLFVRLSRNLPSRLMNDCSTAHSDLSNIEDNDCWKTSPDNKDQSLFLPLRISFGGNHNTTQTLYASYNGGDIILEESSADAIEIPRALLKGISDLPSTVSVEALSWIPHCPRVLVEPVSVDDWELLEVHAQDLEVGGLLRQVSVVYTGQRLRLHLNDGRDSVQVIIQETTSNADEEDSPWPQAENGRTNQEGAPCVLLVQDTEVIVSPKPRPVTKCSDWSSPLRVLPCHDELSEVMLALSKHLKYDNNLIVPPGCILVTHSDWAIDNTIWARISPVREDRDDCIVRVMTSHSVPEGHAAINLSTRLDLGVFNYWDSVQIQPITELTAVAFGDVYVEEMLIEADTFRSSLSCRIPDMMGANCNQSKIIAAVEESWMLPVGSLVFPSQLGSKQRIRSKMFRIKLRNEGPSDGFVFLTAHERSLLLQQRPEFSEHIVKPESEDPSAFLPSWVDSSSTEWSKIILSDMSSRQHTMVVLCGPTGSGKTHSSILLGALARLQQHRATVYLDCKKLQESSNRLVDILAQIDAAFEEAVKATSCLLVLDDLDRLVPNLLGGDGDDSSARVQTANPTAVDQSKLIVDRVLCLMEAAANVTSINLQKRNQVDVSVLITCPSTESLNPSLLQSSRFHRILSVPVLSAEERLVLLKRMVEQVTSEKKTFENVSVAQQIENFRPRDLEKVASRVKQQLRATESNVPFTHVLDKVFENFTPLSHLTLSQAQVASGLNWSDIGGLTNVKAKLESTILHPAIYRPIYEQAKIRLPRGVLLFGPPGCGKSALGPALARECGFPLISCKGPEVLDKYIGASEAKVRELFNRAAAVAPSILFLDELDALAPRRGSDNTGVTDRVVNQLLTFLDGVEDTSNGTVYVVGATSRPDKVDPALLRPGRLEQHLFVGPPESDIEWIDLFSKVATGWNLSTECQRAIASPAKGQNLLRRVIRNGRFSAADVKAALDTAHLHAVHRALKTAPADEIETVEIDEQDLELALLKTRPCLNSDDASVLEDVYSRFKNTGKGIAKGPKLKEARLKTALR